MKNKLIKGTFILSAAGILTRLIGFYYRIFLSNTIGADGMGLYQMIFPMYGLCVSFAVTGIEMAISKYVAAAGAGERSGECIQVLKAGIRLSLFFSCLTAIGVYLFSDFIAAVLIGDIRCSILLKFIAFAIPACAIHGCIIGYFLGKSHTGIPALAQLSEQITRVGVGFLLAFLLSKEQEYLSPVTAMEGLLAGEIMSSVICVIALIKDLRKSKKNGALSEKSYQKKIFSMSFPLSTSRVITSVILSFEAILILRCLKVYGLNHQEAVSIYGVLTGMAMPFIFFPSTITGAISSVILPSISEAQSEGNYVKIARTTSAVTKYCFSIGIFFSALFYLYGTRIGSVLFSNADAGTFISILSWLCPFMYLGSTLGSILNGLGLTKLTFLVNVLVSLSRVGFLWLFVPVYGIRGYLWGILASQMISAFLFLYFVKKHTHFRYRPAECILIPSVITIISIGSSFLIYHFLELWLPLPFLCLVLCITVACLIFAILLFYPQIRQKKK